MMFMAEMGLENGEDKGRMLLVWAAYNGRLRGHALSSWGNDVQKCSFPCSSRTHVCKELNEEAGQQRNMDDLKTKLDRRRCVAD